MSYKYMAFLDVMGYRNYLEEDIKNGNENFKDKLINAFRVFETVDSSDVNYKSISDSIFISVNSTYDFSSFISLLKEIWIAFLEQGLLLRGGVSYDAHFENTHITYSKALTDAYNIESKTAFFPRIVVSSNIFDLDISSIQEIKTRELIIKSGQDFIVNVVTETNVEVIYQQFQILVNNNQSSIDQSAQVRSRYLWLQEYILYRKNDLNKCIVEWQLAFSD